MEKDIQVQNSTFRTIKVWDWPLRLFHLLLIIVIAFQYITAEFVDDAILWHFYGGYTCLALIIFRVLWGMLGSYYSRFSQFVGSPQSAVKYLLGKDNKEYIGHNPAGAYSTIVLLSLVATQTISGLFISDDIFSDALYFGVLSKENQEIADFLHHNAINILLGFIALHVLTVSYYQWVKKQKLINAMLNGSKSVKKESLEQIEPSRHFPWLGFVVCILLTALCMYLVLEVLPPAPADDYFY